MKGIILALPIISSIIALVAGGQWAIPICLVAVAASVLLTRNTQKTVLMMTALSGGVLIAFQIATFSTNAWTEGVLASVIVGAVMMVLGNYMPLTKPNATFGLRLPWTLRSETVWRKSNCFAGYLLVLAGALLIGLSLLFPTAAEFILIVVIIVLLIVATAASYSFAKSHTAH